MLKCDNVRSIAILEVLNEKFSYHLCSGINSVLRLNIDIGVFPNTNKQFLDQDAQELG